MTEEVTEPVDTTADEATEATETTESSTGLLADAVESSQEEETTEATSEKPEYLDPQFWDAEKGEVNTEALQKSQRDFRNKAREKGFNPPDTADAYKFEAPEGIELENGDDDPIIKATKETAFKYNMSQEQYNGFMQEMVKVIADNNPPFDAAAEKAKLGTNADKIIQSVADWGNHLVKMGLWNEDEHKAVIEMGSTAEGIKALTKLRTHYVREHSIPINTAIQEGLPSADELYALVGSERYNNEPEYRKEIQEKFRRRFGTEPAGTSPSGKGVSR